MAASQANAGRKRLHGMQPKILQDDALRPHRQLDAERKMQRAGVGAPGQPAAISANSLLENVGQENPNAKQFDYLITASSILPGFWDASDLRDVTQVTREEMAFFVRDALDNPMVTSARGLPGEIDGSLVKKLVVFQEQHDDRTIQEQRYMCIVQLCIYINRYVSMST